MGHTWTDPVSYNWRWYEDDGAEPTTALAAENAVYAIPHGAYFKVLRLRIQIREQGNLGGTGTLGLKYRNATQPSIWYSVTGASSLVRYYDGQAVEGNTLAGAKLSDTDYLGKYQESDYTQTYNAAQDSDSEYDITIRLAPICPGYTVEFKLVFNGTEISPASGKALPSLEAAADTQTPVDDGNDYRGIDLHYSNDRILYRDGADKLWCLCSDALYGSWMRLMTSVDGGTTWSNEDVYSTSVMYYHYRLQFDSGGNPHVIWIEKLFGQHPQVKYSYKSGGSWLGTPETVSTDATFAELSVDEYRNCDFYIDDSDDVHVVWADTSDASSTGEVYYRKRSGGSWGSIEEVATGLTGSETGCCHITEVSGTITVFYGSSTSTIHYAQSPGSWSQTQWESHSYIDGIQDLRVDDSNNIHLLTGQTRLGYVTGSLSLNGGTYEELSKPSGYTYNTSYFDAASLSLDSGGAVHVLAEMRLSYSLGAETGYTRQPHHNVKQGGSWSGWTQLSDYYATFGRVTAFCEGGTDVDVVFYQDYAQGGSRLYYATVTAPVSLRKRIILGGVRQKVIIGGVRDKIITGA